MWSHPMTRKPTPYGRRPYSCVFTWASEFGQYIVRKKNSTVDWKKKGKTHFSDDRHEAIYEDGPVEDHLGYHSVLAHKVAEL
jgi:hypothetical protein